MWKITTHYSKFQSNQAIEIVQIDEAFEALAEDKLVVLKYKTKKS
jgi:hypothetical protein